MRSGERIVKVDELNGKASVTRYKVERALGDMTLVKASPITGRTHQIRVHCQHIGCSIAGDTKYSTSDEQQKVIELGLKRLFLHASHIQFEHPRTKELIQLDAPMDGQLQRVIDCLTKQLPY